jgi:hypothetical protein
MSLARVRHAAAAALLSLLGATTLAPVAWADAAPMPGEVIPPCPTGSFRKSAGAGHRYCGIEPCAKKACGGGGTCESTAVCLQKITMAGGHDTDDEVVEKQGGVCPQGSTSETRDLCVPPGVAAGASPAPPVKRPGGACSCDVGPRGDARSAQLLGLAFGLALGLLRARAAGSRRRQLAT